MNISEYIQVVCFLSYGTLVDFVKAIIDCSVFRQDCGFGTLAVTVKFVIFSQHTSSLKKEAAISPLIEFIVITFKWF